MALCTAILPLPYDVPVSAHSHLPNCVSFRRSQRPSWLPALELDSARLWAVACSMIVSPWHMQKCCCHLHWAPSEQLDNPSGSLLKAFGETKFEGSTTPTGRSKSGDRMAVQSAVEAISPDTHHTAGIFSQLDISCSAPPRPSAAASRLMRSKTSVRG